MKFLCAMFLFMTLSGCSDNKPDVIPENRTFNFKVGNVKVKNGVAVDAASVASEIATIETVIRLSPTAK